MIAHAPSDKAVCGSVDTDEGYIGMVTDLQADDAHRQAGGADEYVLRSAAEYGFWSNTDGWVYDVASASRFSAGPVLTLTPDAQLIPVGEAQDFNPNHEHLADASMLSLFTPGPQDVVSDRRDPKKSFCADQQIHVVAKTSEGDIVGKTGAGAYAIVELMAFEVPTVTIGSAFRIVRQNGEDVAHSIEVELGRATELGLG